MPRRARHDPKQAVAYIRCSKEEQQLSPDAQREAIVSYAARHGLHVASWHVDAGVSGADDLADRPALLEALKALRTHRAGVLLVLRRDRLARDAGVAITIDHAVRKHGAIIVTADGVANGDGPSDIFMRRILDANSEHELALLKARTKAALAVKRQRGERISGHAPYGFRFNGDQVEPDPLEFPVRERARALRAEGASTYKIAASLNAEGHRSRAGTPFSQVQAWRMVADVG